MTKIIIHYFVNNITKTKRDKTMSKQMKYDFTTQAQLRNAFWQGSEHLKHYAKSKTQNEYNATIRSEFVEFVE